MNDLAEWMRWCGDLGRQDRALAWLGMGVVRAHLGPYLPGPLDPLLADLLADSRTGTRTPWSSPADWTAGMLLLTPQGWSQAAGQALSGHHDRQRGQGPGEPLPARLLVRSDEGEDDWLDLLRDCPLPLAISRGLEGAGAPVLRWPLRLASLLPTGLAACERARQEWPANRLTESFAIGRERSNCDLLVHPASLRSLLAQVLQLPFKCKSNIVLVEGTGAQAPSDAELRFAAQAISASAVVALPRGLGTGQLGLALNSFVTELSHDVPFDVALFRGFGSADIHAGEQLAGHRLSSLAQEMVERVKAAAGRVPRMRAVEAALQPATMSFDRESAGASQLAAVGAELAAAVPPEVELQASAARFLQQQSFRSEQGEVPARGGFRVGIPCAVDLRIGPQEGAWQSLATPLPLPATQDFANLTVWLAEPDQLLAASAGVMRGTMVLPPAGPGSTCRFQFIPQRAGTFDGRVSVLHHGRVLQTARLVARVLDAQEAASDAGEGTPRLEELHPVRQRLGELAERRQFDLCFVTNHAQDGAARAVVLSDQRAWISSLDASRDTIKEINATLSAMAKSAADYVDGLDGDAGRELLVTLANQGSFLRLDLVGEQLARPGNNAQIGNEEYIQLVSTRTDSVVPFEFIYDYAAPADDATLCPSWRGAVKQGGCLATCSLPHAEPGAGHVCPMGFWGLRKVIERHQLARELVADGKELFLQSEPGRATKELELRGPVVLAASKRVPEDGRARVRNLLAEYAGFVSQETVKTWDEWKDVVVRSNPRLILTMPHTDGTGSNVSLEIEGLPLKVSLLTRGHVCPADDSAAPVVALLGCDIAETLHDYSKYVAVFRARGAAIVVATIATVSGSQAPAATAALARSLLGRKGEPFFLGEAVRQMRRESLLRGELMPLAVVAYGDADWKLKAGA